MEDDTLIVTVNITSILSESGNTKNVSMTESYPVDTTWGDIMSQFVRSLNSYGFVIRNRTIEIDSEGYCINARSV